MKMILNKGVEKVLKQMSLKSFCIIFMLIEFKERESYV